MPVTGREDQNSQASSALPALGKSFKGLLAIALATSIGVQKVSAISQHEQANQLAQTDAAVESDTALSATTVREDDQDSIGIEMAETANT